MITKQEHQLMKRSNKENPQRTQLTPLRVSYAKRAYGDILDLGGGVGRFLPFLHGNVVICDINYDDMMALDYKKKIILDANETLPFKDNSFDTVWASGVCHFLDMDKFVEEAKRITRPNGKIIIMIPNLKSIWAKCLRAMGKRSFFDQKGIHTYYSYPDLLKYGGKVVGEIRFLPFDCLLRWCLPLSHSLITEIIVQKELQ